MIDAHNDQGNCCGPQKQLECGQLGGSLTATQLIRRNIWIEIGKNMFLYRSKP